MIVEPPFACTRNPMALGTILMYLGMAVVRRSLAGIGLVAAAGSVLLFYIKRFEEAEMLTIRSPRTSAKAVTPSPKPSHYSSLSDNR